jgi:hypothetical protein
MAPMMETARRMERDTELAALLRSLAASDDESVRAWVSYELSR